MKSEWILILFLHFEMWEISNIVEFFLLGNEIFRENYTNLYDIVLLQKSGMGVTNTSTHQKFIVLYWQYTNKYNNINNNKNIAI